MNSMDDEKKEFLNTIYTLKKENEEYASALSDKNLEIVNFFF